MAILSPLGFFINPSTCSGFFINVRSLDNSGHFGLAKHPAKHPPSTPGVEEIAEGEQDPKCVESLTDSFHDISWFAKGTVGLLVR